MTDATGHPDTGHLDTRRPRRPDTGHPHTGFPDTRHPDPGFLETTRNFYDTIAEDYADRFRPAGAGTPLDRALMGAFAELVGPEGQVADVSQVPQACLIARR
ncbi:hypothetical protein [Streptomyces sp. NPDC017890]|uniref:hypothetical protein n=1 Tax=Streptomyces sp. NPDC017890 TaxID=3365015 RepID=UPI0037B9184F